MADVIETRWFRIVVFILSIFIIGFLIAAIVYFNRIRTNGTVTPGEATAMLWIAGILTIIFGIIAIWALVVLLTPTEVKQQVTTYLTSPEPIIYTNATVPSQQPVVQQTTVTKAQPIQQKTTTTYTTAPQKKTVTFQ